MWARAALWWSTLDSDGWPVPARLVEHARRFYAEGGEPAMPRVAATVMLVRPADADFQVYAIRRAATMAFASGMYAFPGGSVDPSDSDASIGWAGPPPAAWADRLGLAVGPAQAVVCAAVREVFEEAGVLLAGYEPSTVVGEVTGARWEQARKALVSRQTSLTGLFHDGGLILRSDLLRPWSRWVTPEFEPRRFDTYFFLARLPEGQHTQDVSGEADHTLWVRPADALDRLAAGEIAMLPPTMATLRELASCSDVDSLLAAADHRDAATPLIPRLAGDRLVL